MEEDKGEAPKGLQEGTESSTGKRGTESPAIAEQLMEEVCGSVRFAELRKRYGEILTHAKTAGSAHGCIEVGRLAGQIVQPAVYGLRTYGWCDRESGDLLPHVYWRGSRFRSVANWNDIRQGHVDGGLRYRLEVLYRDDGEQ